MATLQLGIDARKAQMGASQFDAATRRVKHSARNAALAAAAIGTAIGVASLKFVQVASDAQETQSKFDVVFRHLRNEANAWADDYADSVGRARQDTKKWMAGLQDTFVPLGIARDKAFELSKSLTTLAVDVASFNNKTDASVIRDFTSALVGNHETVRKYGIIIGESAIQQEAYAKGINKSYKNLTDLQKVMLRYSLIQKGTTDAQGDAIRTADSYANQQKRLEATWTNMQQTLGEALLPAYTKAITNINTLLTENQSRIKKWAEDTVEGFDVVGDAITGFMQKLEAAEKAGHIPAFEKGDIRSLGGRFGGPIGPMPEKQPWGYHESPTSGMNMLEYSRRQRSIAGDYTLDPQRTIDEAFQATQPQTFMDTQPPLVRAPLVAVGTDGASAQTRLTAEEEEKRKEKQRRFAYERARITADMYADMRQYGEGYYQAQKSLLDSQKEDYAQYVTDKALLNEWYARKEAEARAQSSAQWQFWGQSLTGMREGLSGFFMDLQTGTQSAGDAFDNFTRRMVNSFQNAVADMAAKAVMSSLTSAIFGAPMASALGFGFDRGAAFDRGRVVAFAGGGIVDRTTLFPMASGAVGMMGESGPEAVMPLRRGVNGRLGVEATGGSANGGVIIQNEVTVINETGSPVKADVRGPTFNGEKYITQVVLRSINEYGAIRQAIVGLNGSQ